MSIFGTWTTQVDTGMLLLVSSARLVLNMGMQRNGCHQSLMMSMKSSLDVRQVVRAGRSELIHRVIFIFDLLHSTKVV